MTPKIQRSFHSCISLEIEFIAPEGKNKKKEILLVVSLPLEEQACSSCLSNSRSLEIYLLCVFVFQPGAGPAGEPIVEFFCLGLFKYFCL